MQHSRGRPILGLVEGAASFSSIIILECGQVIEQGTRVGLVNARPLDVETEVNGCIGYIEIASAADHPRSSTGSVVWTVRTIAFVAMGHPSSARRRTRRALMTLPAALKPADEVGRAGARPEDLHRCREVARLMDAGKEVHLGQVRAAPESPPATAIPDRTFLVESSESYLRSPLGVIRRQGQFRAPQTLEIPAMMRVSIASRSSYKGSIDHAPRQIYTGAKLEMADTDRAVPAETGSFLSLLRKSATRRSMRSAC
jgi:hypothetical protein